MSKIRIRSFLHYRDDLGNGTRTDVVFDECPAKCSSECTAYKVLPEADFCDDTKEKEYYSPSELAEYLIEEKVRYYSKKLGITFLGMEPLNNPYFCRECALILQKNGISLDIYTCGTAPKVNLDMLAPLTDLLFVRLFTLNPSKYRVFSGFSLAPVLENISYINYKKFPYRFLIPIIAGLNSDSAEELATYCKLLSNAKSVILDFSKSGLSPEEITTFRRTFLHKGIILY